MDNIYHEYILDLYKNPLNKNKLANFDKSHRENNVTCGDSVEIYVKFNGQKVAEIGWQGDGCAISQAATSLLTDFVKNKTKKQIKGIKQNKILAMLGLEKINPTRLRCALLSLETIKNIIA